MKCALDTEDDRAPPPAGATVHVAGNVGQLHTGQGDQNIAVTYTHVLESLRTRVASSDMAPDAKGTVLQKIDDLLRDPMTQPILSDAIGRGAGLAK